MANPAPTINQINAFNATQGTIIDFNIIGGTELVRSNRIYIYDLSDNSLICTHLYVSTESIHELPANTDSSIVYESGKSSADFVNGAQYYAQIQTYTDTAGTEGGSGLSVAKMFWCLVNPTLTITTIPSTISTTSYNVSATYNANTSVVSNIIQQYQFRLYSATGSLLQSSGVVVGSGTQQGTSTAYDISYNFTGLSVGSSYYVVVDVTTTQGMNVSTQSNTFTVSIDTPTLGEATVVNNACDGYISVTSNLSGEYGGSASGEIASFVTSSVNDVSSLKVTLDPIQDGTPWIGTDHDNTPYLHRAMPTQSNDYNRESLNSIVGATVAWNQLIEHGNFDAVTGWSGAGYGTFTVSSNVGNLTLSAVSGSACLERNFTPIVGHKYLVTIDIKTPYDTRVFSTFQAGAFNTQIGRETLTANVWSTVVGIKNAEVGDTTSGKIRYYVGDTTASVGDVVQFRNAMVIDLTREFDSSIVNYVYQLEQSTAGSGVAWLKAHFPKMFAQYNEYNAGELKSVSGLVSHDTVGKNLVDVDSGSTTTTVGIGSIVLQPGTYTYSVYLKRIDGGNSRARVTSGDYVVEGTAVSGSSFNRSTVTFTITETRLIYLAVQFLSSYSTMYYERVQLEFGSTATNYEEYIKHSYPLDSDLTLRGRLYLDSNNELRADGDVYPPSGGVGRRYSIVDLGTLNWATYNANRRIYYANVPNLKVVADTSIVNVVCLKYTAVTATATWVNGNIATTSTYDGRIFICDTDYEDNVTFKQAMDGVYLVYELATTTSEQADPYTQLQVADPNGTEEFVTDSIMPIGQESTYSLVCPVYGHDEVSVEMHGKNLFDKALLKDQERWNQIVLTLQPNTQYTMSTSLQSTAELYIYFYPYAGNPSSTYEVMASHPVTVTTNADGLARIQQRRASGSDSFQNYNWQIELGSTATDYEPYDGQTITTPLPTTVYGGTVDVVNGTLTVDRAMVDLGTLNWIYVDTYGVFYAATTPLPKDAFDGVCSAYPFLGNYASLPDKSAGYIYYNRICVKDSEYGTDTTAFKAAMSGVQLVYTLATPQTYSLTPQQIQTLLGRNNVWSDGAVSVEYNIPITNLLVKRQDVADVSGTWLTLYSQPITQASDMDFTFIDFLNQYGKTYKYALVPLLTQTQSGVEVEVEGGYTVSDEVQSVFDGVFIADQTGSQKCKANVGYGDVDMNQSVGTITPIGAKYPVVITNSKNQYHNGSISGTIVPDDYYFNGNLSRIDMVNKRNELEQFLTNKRAKIIKDWNSNIWLVMIMENINCSFNNEYGMGLVNFNASWIEVGDPTNQQDLQAAGLIDVGGV